MYDLILDAIGTQFRRFHETHDQAYDDLKKAWCASKKWMSTRNRPLNESMLLPYIGSGLNGLAEGGVHSWGALVKEVAEQNPDELGTEHQVRRSGLTLPQQLEIHLRETNRNIAARANVLTAFQRAFDQPGKPSAFHKRLATSFPILLTTNYNSLLESADPLGRKVFDLTLPNCEPNLMKPCICYLHGRWIHGIKRKDLDPRIFSGVGIHEPLTRPCLVLTENQYHRLYSEPDFKGALESVLGPPNLLLFLGAGLTNDEAGIHNILTARRLSQKKFAGLYVGLDLDPLKERLLDLRGIQCINLPRAFGYSKGATEALFHALFDKMEQLFEESTPYTLGIGASLKGPDILCVGLAAWNRVFSLGNERFIGSEISHTINSDAYKEEPGGQHLWPALYLVNRGHRVALATTSGDDSLGDQVRKSVRRFVEDATRRSGGDLIDAPWQIEGDTRLTTVITFDGTRVIFDFDGKGLAKLSDWRTDWEQWDSLEAIYLGSYYLDFEEQLLRKMSHIKLKFFETGTRGPIARAQFERSRNIARQCSHVLSSSAFALRLAGMEKFATGSDTLVCQNRVHRDFVKGKGGIIKRAVENLWDSPSKHGNLIVVMGKHGSLVAARGKEVRHVEATPVPRSRGRNWLGCGDLFRAEFIHQIMQGKSCEHAARTASRKVAEKIQRMSFLSPA